jgi:hypothetical protein
VAVTVPAVESTHYPRDPVEVHPAAHYVAGAPAKQN